MERIDELTNEFMTKLEQFMIGCDAVEDAEQWDKDENGEMELFFENDLVSVILRLIASDGEISEKEAEYLNKTFGFDYTGEELKEVYKNCSDEIGGSFDETFRDGVARLRAISEPLADAYNELLCLICDIIAESDGVVSPDEIEEIKNLKELF